MPERRRYSEDEVRAAVADSLSYAEVLRRLGLRAAGGNHRTIRKYVEDVWRIPVDHFDAQRARRSPAPARASPLAEVLVEASTYHRGHLKRRLLAEGLKRPECEICGQGEIWRGRRMSLVLDHINGVHDDHRLENLRILCPNCNATLDTHCGRHKTRKHHDRPCPTCLVVFRPASGGQRYCSASCAGRGERSLRAQAARRRVPRPPYDQLLREIEALGYLAVGRKYGVSDNAIRKWRRAYEAERATAAAVDDRWRPLGPPAGPGADPGGDGAVPAREVSATDGLTAASL
jgi:hypothetical protein